MGDVGGGMRVCLCICVCVCAHVCVCVCVCATSCNATHVRVADLGCPERFHNATKFHMVEHCSTLMKLIEDILTSRAAQNSDTVKTKNPFTTSSFGICSAYFLN